MVFTYHSQSFAKINFNCLNGTIEWQIEVWVKVMRANFIDSLLLYISFEKSAQGAFINYVATTPYTEGISDF